MNKQESVEGSYHILTHIYTEDESLHDFLDGKTMITEKQIQKHSENDPSMKVTTSLGNRVRK